MLNSLDEQTVVSCRLLRRVVEQGSKPLVIWLGAGTSAWNNFPLWNDLARQMRREFFQANTAFNNKRALELIDTDLPGFFQMCRDLDAGEYRRWLTNSFKPKPISDLYRRLIQQLRNIAPVHIITTNTDETLEQSLGPVRVIQKSDLSLCPELLQSSASFIGKLHGTVSSVQTMVFTTKDYDALKSDSSFVSSVKAIFQNSSVVFIGYSLRDGYLLDLLKETADENRLFGAGPYFVVTGDPAAVIPNIHRICYRSDRFKDHRAAMMVLDLINQSLTIRDPDNIAVPLNLKTETQSESTRETAYYISDFKPPGTWRTHETVEIKGSDGTTGTLTCGLGFTRDELPIDGFTAMHDFAVGLICFDRVYLPLISLSALFTVVKEALFREIVNSDALRFVHTLHLPAVIYEPGSTFGSLNLVLLRGSAPTALEQDTYGENPELAVREMLSRQVSPASGREDEAKKFIDELENLVHVFRYRDGEGMGSGLTDAFLMPHVSKLLGIGDAILPSQVPLWLKFPYLRMADLVHTGNICSHLGIPAAKVPFGGPQLVSAAFGVQIASEWAESVASYSVSGRFDTNLGAYLTQQPEIIRQLLRFRNSAEGEGFRREVGLALMRETGAEFTASVNAGLKRNIPSNVLQKANAKLETLMTESSKITTVPAIWSDPHLSDNSTESWRRKSLAELEAMCKLRGIWKDDPCICNSGDKLRLCCMHPLKT